LSALGLLLRCPHGVRRRDDRGGLLHRVTSTLWFSMNVLSERHVAARDSVRVATIASLECFTPSTE
jgi:hypothetical protein